MTDTDAPPLASTDRATNSWTESPGFGVDDAEHRSEFGSPPEGV